MNCFCLTEEQEKKLKKWQNKIKKKHGNFGTFTYSFTPSGIGTVIKVYSELLDRTIDLTDIDTW